MANAEQITHLITMIHMEADSIHNSAISEVGFLNRLQEEINNSGFAADGTLEIMMLEKSEKYLRQTADAIEKARLQLLSNSKTIKSARIIGPYSSVYGEPF